MFPNDVIESEVKADDLSFEFNLQLRLTTTARMQTREIESFEQAKNEELRKFLLA